jgi:hypothetical protein
MKTYKRENEFFRSFLEALLWSSGGTLDKYDSDDISHGCYCRLKIECSEFERMAGDMIASDLAKAGHDFALTRNHHGAGFWDGDWHEHGEELTMISHRFPEVDLYLGDDGLIYC